MVAGKRAGEPTKKRQTGPKQKKNGQAEHVHPDGPDHKPPVSQPAEQPAPSAPEAAAPHPATESPPPAGHNSAEIEEDFEKERMFKGVLEYLDEFELIEDAKKRWSRYKKRVKEQKIDITEFEVMVKLDSAEGLLTQRAKLEREAKIRSWFTGLKQKVFDFQAESRRSPIDVARHDGEVACLKAKDRTKERNGGRYMLGSPEYLAWCEGYDRLMANLARRRGEEPLPPTPMEAYIQSAPQPVDAPDITPLSDEAKEHLAELLGEDVLNEVTEELSGDPGGPMEMLPPETGEEAPQGAPVA